jgi:hypothetical protein
LQLAFETKALRDSCEIQSLCVSQYGELVTASLTGVLSDLVAAQCPLDLPWFEVDSVTPEGDIVTALADGYVLVWRPKYESEGHTGEIDWKRVNRVKLLLLRQADDQ